MSDQTETAEGFRIRKVQKMATEITAENATTTTILDSVPMDSALAVRWTIHATSSTGKVGLLTIEAAHSANALPGDPSVDYVKEFLSPGATDLPRGLDRTEVDIHNQKMILKMQPEGESLTLQVARQILI